MKLKSKLIASIVSICAAIAVMGIGVWAASTSFSVHVENSVNLSFTQLEGTVKVTGTADAYAWKNYDEKYTTLGETTLYNSAISATDATDKSGNGIANIVGASDATNGGDEVVTDITNFFTGDKDTSIIDLKSCCYAYVMYTFVYTPNEHVTDDKYVDITIDETAFPQTNGDYFNSYYLIRTGSYASDNYLIGEGDGNGDENSFNGPITLTVKADQTITITAILKYENIHCASIKTNTTAWNFNIDFDTDSATSQGKDYIKAYTYSIKTTSGLLTLERGPQQYSNEYIFNN